MDQQPNNQEQGDSGPSHQPARAESAKLRAAVRGMAMDITPLRISYDFRVLFLGQTVSFFGSMMRANAVLPMQMYQLTKSSLAVGMLGLVEFVPMLLAGLVGGALADYVDRGRLLRATEAGMALTAAALAVNSLLPHPRVWVLYVIAVIFSGLNGLQRPAREAIMPRILPSEHMPAVAALNSFRYSVGAIAGPAAGGMIFAAIGPFAAYCVDLSTFAFSIVTLLMIRALPPPVTTVRPNLRSIVEGLSYAKSRQVLMGTYVIDMIAMFFGMPLALFPAMAEGMGRPEATGFLYAAPAIGSLVTSLLSGHLAIVRRHGLAILISVVVWGLAIVALGFAHSLVLAMICLAIAGGADMVSGMFRQTIWNQSIPDHLRGRLAGIEMISYMSGPQLGNAEAGAVATLFSIRTSILSGGILCLVGTAVLVAVLPGFVTYDQSEGMKHKEEAEAARLTV